MSKDAVSWCATGVLGLACTKIEGGKLPLGSLMHAELMRDLSYMVLEAAKSDEPFLNDWNDPESTTHADVINAFDAAISEVEKLDDKDRIV